MSASTCGHECGIEVKIYVSKFLPVIYICIFKYVPLETIKALGIIIH